MKKAETVAFLGIFIAIAFIASYIERIVPSPVPAVPGIKLGLANTLIIILLYVKSAKMAFGVNIARIIASGIMFLGVFGMFYSLFGALLSFAVMYIALKCRVFGIIGVSVCGGVVHNIGQIMLATLIVGNIKLFFYIPILILSGVIAGMLIGFIAGMCIKRLSPGFFSNSLL